MNLSKIIRLSLVISLVLVSFISCKKDKDNTPSVLPGTVTFIFENYAGNDNITLGGLNYTNNAGNNFSVDLLKYYISNINFKSADGSEFKAPNYELINESDQTSFSFNVELPQGTYTGFNFLMGVDSVKNISGAQSGELDPQYGMFWDWSTGYVYLKHEGTFIDAIGDTLPLVYHYGTLPALTMHEFNQQVDVNAVPRVIKMKFDLLKLYNSPNQVDFNNNNIHSGGNNFINTLRENLAGAFSVKEII